MKCLTDEQIAIFIDGMTGDREFPMIKKHLARCDKCLSRMNEVYTLLELDEEQVIQKPPMPEINNVRTLRTIKPRYYIPAAAAAAVVLISIVVLKVNAPVDITPGNGITITKTDTGNGISTVKTSEKGIFSVAVKKEIAAEILKDTAKISSSGVSMNTMTVIKGDKSSDTGMMTTDDRLAFERKILLIRCGYYYYMLKQTGDSALLEKVRDIMEMGFPDISLQGLTEASFDAYEKNIAGAGFADRDAFLKGFFLSYYLYSQGKVDEGDSSVKNVIESLKDEKALGINNLFTLKGVEHEKLAVEMKRFFMM